MTEFTYDKAMTLLGEYGAASYQLGQATATPDRSTKMEFEAREKAGRAMREFVSGALHARNTELDRLNGDLHDQIRDRDATIFKLRQEIETRMGIMASQRQQIRKLSQSLEDAALAQPAPSAEGRETHDHPTEPASGDRIDADLNEDFFISEATKHPILGPNYFAGREIANRFMSQFEDEHFKPLVDKFTDLFREQLWESLSDYLISDTTSNIHSAIWRRADGTVKALLSGQPWALQQYVFNDQHGDGQKIRAAIAKQIPEEIQNTRITELEAENEKLRKEVQWLANQK